ncbi:MAG: hypothetical protein Q8O27_00770 [Enterobacteriaceae bacterium]|nr:hypothetical protein [Enterobacteriaceae bacterium]
MTKQRIILIPKDKKNWVGKQYEYALLISFNEGGLILLTKKKGERLIKTKSHWAFSFWKIK